MLTAGSADSADASDGLQPGVALTALAAFLAFGADALDLVHGRSPCYDPAQRVVVGDPEAMAGCAPPVR